MTRRRMLLSMTAPGLVRTATERPAVRITCFTLAPILGRFHKFVAMNSYDTAPKGHTYSNTLVRVSTDAGVEGVGVKFYPQLRQSFLGSPGMTG